jgi:hypothetical protein
LFPVSSTPGLVFLTSIFVPILSFHFHSFPPRPIDTLGHGQKLASCEGSPQQKAERNEQTDSQ